MCHSDSINSQKNAISWHSFLLPLVNSTTIKNGRSQTGQFVSFSTRILVQVTGISIHSKWKILHLHMKIYVNMKPFFYFYKCFWTFTKRSSLVIILNNFEYFLFTILNLICFGFFIWRLSATQFLFYSCKTKNWIWTFGVDLTQTNKHDECVRDRCDKDNVVLWLWK